MDFFKRENERNIDMARSRKKFARSSNKRELFFYFNNNQLCCALLRPPPPLLFVLFYLKRAFALCRVILPFSFFSFFCFPPLSKKTWYHFFPKRENKTVWKVSKRIRVYICIYCSTYEKQTYFASFFLLFFLFWMLRGLTTNCFCPIVQKRVPGDQRPACGLFFQFVLLFE